MEPDCAWRAEKCQYNCSVRNNEPWLCDYHPNCHYDPTTAECHVIQHCEEYDEAECSAHGGNDCFWQDVKEVCHYNCSKHDGNVDGCRDHSEDCHYDTTTAKCSEMHLCEEYNETECGPYFGGTCE